MLSHHTFITFITLVLAVLATAGPTALPRQDADLVTFCFQDGSCFQASALAEGCVELPLFSEPFETASLSAPGLECILSVGTGCGGTSVLFNSAGTVNLNSALGLATVGSFICTSDVDIINLCFPSATQDCFQATTITDGCANTPRFGLTFASVSLTTNGTQCTIFEDQDCAGDSASIDEPVVNFDLGTLGLSTVESFSCVD
ncbi:hypothetical protein DFH07DRAFT_786618, partial [Mycena maculata]